MELYYLSTTGERIDFMEDPIFCGEPESLLSSEWKYETTTKDAWTARVAKLYRAVSEHSVTISILADTKEQFNEVMRKMERVFETDIHSGRMGRLYWNDCYRNVLCIQREPEDFVEFCDTTDVELTFLECNPGWLEEQSWTIQPRTGADEDATVYPHRYPYTYSITQKNTYIGFDHYQDSDFLIKAYGPTTAVYVTIGEHLYAVDYEVETGEVLIIDSRPSTEREKRCYVIHADGTEENVFNYRNSEQSLFERIPAGASKIAYTGGYRLEVTIFKERSDPEWI